MGEIRRRWSPDFKRDAVVLVRRRATDGSFRRRSHGEAVGPAGGDHQADLSAQSASRHTFITAALDAGVPLRDLREPASRADPRTTMRYDRGRHSLDRHATYVVFAFFAGASRPKAWLRRSGRRLRWTLNHFG
jgi:hypothetical protein